MPELNANMISVTITDRNSDLCPFPKQLWEDPQVVYHGTWSLYSPRVEVEGFGHAELPFNHEDIATVMHARAALDLGSRAGIFFGSTPDQARADLSMSANFWCARAYATDGGGEAVRLTIEDAKHFEAFCASAERRAAQIHEWESALKHHPTHAPTRKALELLLNNSRMNDLCTEVRAARQRIESVTTDGFPVIYALRIESQWFTDLWERYIYHWKKGHRATVELRCRRDWITVDRLVAKAMYPNGTDPDKQWDGVETWKQLGLLPWDKIDKSACGENRH